MLLNAIVLSTATMKLLGSPTTVYCGTCIAPSAFVRSIGDTVKSGFQLCSGHHCLNWPIMTPLGRLWMPQGSEMQSRADSLSGEVSSAGPDSDGRRN